LDFACLIIDRLNLASAWDVTSCGPSLREKVVDVLRRLSKSALSFQVHPGRGNPITLGIENRDPITAVALVVKYKFVSVIAVRAGCHLDANERIPTPAGACA
jgi:hypothetical protein